MFVIMIELESNFDLFFIKSGVTDYAKINRIYNNLTTIGVGVWIKTDDKENYGTVLSYANEDTDNAITLTDYGG